MNSSAALLSILLAMGMAAVGIFWGVNERNSARRKLDVEISKVQRQADKDVGSLLEKLDEANDEKARLEDEVRELGRRLTLEKDTTAELLRARDRLESRLASLEAGGARGESGRDWSDEEIDLRERTETLTVAIRELPLTGPVGYRSVDPDGMRTALAERPGLVVEAEAEAEAQSRAYAAMGFVSPGTDVRARMLDLLEGQLGAALYAGDNTVLFNEEGTTRSVHDRTALALEVVRAIQDQHFGLWDALGQWEHNDDARLALWSAAVGDSSLVKIRFQLQDDAAASDELLQSPTKMTREQFQRIPAFLREYYLFPFALGDRFCQKLHEEGRWAAVGHAVAEPPGSTAEVLHPELYLGDDKLEPEAFRWPIDGLAVGGSEPIWNNVAGELGTALMLNQSNFLQRMSELGQPDVLDMPELVSKGIDHFSNRDGSRAAAGWAGDRYLVYPAEGAEAGDDHVYWRSKWVDEKEADEFYRAIRKALAFRRGVVFGEGDGWAEGGGRAILVRKIGDDQVGVVDAGDRAFGEALWEKFEEAPGGAG